MVLANGLDASLHLPPTKHFFLPFHILFHSIFSQPKRSYKSFLIEPIERPRTSEFGTGHAFSGNEYPVQNIPVKLNANSADQKWPGRQRPGTLDAARPLGFPAHK